VQSGLRAVEAFGSPTVRSLAEYGWFDTLMEGPAWFFEGERVRLALLARLVTDPSGAAAPIRTAITDLERREMNVSAATLRYLLSLLAPDDDANLAALSKHADQVPGIWLQSCAADARARAGGDADEHLAAVDELVAVGDLLHAHLSLGHVRDPLPELTPAAGSVRRAIDERLRAVSRSSDLPLPVDLAAPAEQRLTARELDIARRVAAGARNREVAEALGVSKRTVDNTLANVYRKLGCGGRAGLAAAVGVEPS